MPYLLVQSAEVLHEVMVFPLQRADTDGVPAQLVADAARLLVHALQRVLAVVEVLVQLAGRCQHLDTNTESVQMLTFKST